VFYVHNQPSVVDDLLSITKLQLAKTDVTPAILSRVFDALLWCASKSHRIQQRSIPKTSRATVRRAMTKRATRPVTLVTLTCDPLSRVKVARQTLSQVWHRSNHDFTQLNIVTDQPQLESGYGHNADFIQLDLLAVTQPTTSQHQRKEQSQTSIFMLTTNCRRIQHISTTTPQPFYGLFSGTTRVSRCQKRTSGHYGARED